MASVMVIQGPDKGRTFALVQGDNTIGRQSDPITLSDGTASRQHASMMTENGNWVLSDLGSANGTFVNGRRVTDQATLEIVMEVLVERINASIVREINRLGGMAEQVYAGCNDCIVARPLKLTDEQGRPCDLGYVGEVAEVKHDVLHRLLSHDMIPVIAPLCADADGQHFNINADTVAAELAARLHCEKLVYMSDTHGIYTDASDPTSLAGHLSERDISRLVADGTISSGMEPKVEGCLRAVKAGVLKAHIIDGRIPHSLLLEIFTVKGIGTEIVPD